MQLKYVISIIALALAACGQAEAPKQDAAPVAAPQSLIDQVRSMSPEQQPVFAWQQLTAFQQAHPEAQPPCSSIRRVDVVGEIPDDVAADSIYAAYKGGLVFTVQCGPQLTTVRDEPREQWLVAFMPGAAESSIVNCANAQGLTQCMRTVPRTTTP